MSLYDLTKAAVKDDSGKLLDPTDFDANIVQALKRYSKHRPHLVVEDLTGNATHDLPLPVGWCDGLSSIINIEYPVGAVPETLLDPSDWLYYRTPTGQKLRLSTLAPGITETIRVLYNALHTEATLPEVDEEAVANLAASLCLRQLATAYGQTGDSTIQADVVNYRSKTDEFRRLADSFETLYKNHLGLKDNDTVPAAMATALPPARNRRRLTHGG
jgi:hypothetical protein